LLFTIDVSVLKSAKFRRQVTIYFALQEIHLAVSRPAGDYFNRQWNRIKETDAG